MGLKLDSEADSDYQRRSPDEVEQSDCGEDSDCNEALTADDFRYYRGDTELFQTRGQGRG